MRRVSSWLVSDQLLSLGQQTWAPVWTQEVPQAIKPAAHPKEQALFTQASGEGQSALEQQAPLGMQEPPHAKKPSAHVGAPVQA
jgi:hypothetical protein